MICPRCGTDAPREGSPAALSGICAVCLARDLFATDAEPPEQPRIPEEAADGVRCGRYLKVKEIGRGGMGEVWKAWDTLLGRWVALKFLKGDEQDHPRFLREAQIAGALTHPNIAAVYETGETEGTPYIALQYLEGFTLDYFPRKDLAQAVALVRDAALAIEFSHSKGVIHRDLKPRNMMAVTSSETPGQYRVCVMDFGLARPIAGGQELSVTGVVLGTPAYMSPEQAGGSSVDARTDIYSLGATLYEIVSGKPPFSGENVLGILDQIRSQDPKRLRKLVPDTPPDLETIISKCLEKDPSRRYPSARALADDLTRYLEGKPIEARAPSVSYHLRKWIARNAALSFAYAAVVVAVVATAVLLTRDVLERGREKERLEEARKTALNAAVERARERELEAEAAKKALERSEGLRLAAHSGAALATNPTLAFLLAREAATHSTALPVQNALRSSMDALREIKTLEEGEPVHHASFSADGNLLLTFERDVRLWNGRTGELLRTFPVGLCEGAALSPDARRILTMDRTGMDIRDAATGKTLARAERQAKPGEGRNEAAYGPDFRPFSPDGKRFVALWLDRSVAVMDAETARPVLLLKGHEGKVLGANFSPDGAKVVAWSDDQTVRIWRASDGTPLATLDWLRKKESGSVDMDRRPTLLVAEQACFSPDSRRVLVTTQHGSMVWNLEPVRLEYDLGAGSRFAVFSPDGRYLLSHESGDQFADVNIHDLSNRKVTGTLRGHPKAIWSARFSPTGRWIVTASDDRTARIWDRRTATELAQFVGHSDGVRVAQLSPDEKFLFTATNKSSHLWHPARGARRSTIDQGRSIQNLALSPDGAKLVTQREHSSTQIWDLDKWARVATLEDDVGRPHFSPDGRWIYASRGSEAGVWDASTGKRMTEMAGHEDQVFDVLLNPAGDTFITTGEDGNVFLWDLQGKRQTKFLHSPQKLSAHARLNPGGNTLAVTENDRVVALYDFPALTNRRECAGHAEEIRSIGWSPDGRWLYSVGRDNAIKVWNSATAALQLTVPTADWLREPCFTPDGGRLLALTASHGSATVELWQVPEARRVYAVTEASGMFWQMAVSMDRSRFLICSTETGALLFDTSTGKQIRKFPPPFSERDMVFLPDGKRMLTASMDGISMIDLETGERLKNGMADTGHHTSIEVSPDGKRIVVDIWHNSMVIHDLKNPGREVVLSGHGWQIFDAAFSPDGTQVVTSSYDQTARVWDAATGERRLLLGGHGDRLRAGRFSDDGSRIVTRSENGTVTLWNASDGKKLAVLGGPADPIPEAGFIAGTNRVLAAHQNGRLVIHDERESRAVALDASVVSVRPSPFGPLAVIVDGMRTVIDFPGEQRFRRPPSIQVKRSGVFRIWDVAQGRELRKFTLARPIDDAFWTAQGRQIVTLERRGDFEIGASWTVRLWEVETGRELRTFGGSGYIDVEITPDGKYLFAGAGRNNAGGARLFDLQQGVEIATFPPDVLWTEARFTADGKSLVTRSHEGQIRVHPIDPFAAAPLPPRQFSADEMEQFEIGTSDERLRRRWEALSPFLRDLTTATDLLRESSAHEGTRGFAWLQLIRLKQHLNDPTLQGSPPPALGKAIEEFRSLGISDPELEKSLKELESVIRQR